jgi:hypothetical protein
MIETTTIGLLLHCSIHVLTIKAFSPRFTPACGHHRVLLLRTQLILRNSGVHPIGGGLGSDFLAVSGASLAALSATLVACAAEDVEIC